MRHHPVWIKKLLYTQAVTAGAGTGRVIEGKQPRFQFTQGVATLRAGEAGGKDQIIFIFAHPGNADNAFGKIQGSFNRIGQAGLDIGADLEAIHHRFNGMFTAQVQFGRLVQLDNLAIDARANIAFGAQHFENLFVLTLALVDDWGEQHQFAAFGQSQNMIDHLTDRLRIEHDIMLRAARFTGAGKEQTQVVVNFSDGAHGGARVVRS